MGVCFGALTCALGAYLVYKYFGWRLAVAAALVLVTLPQLWNAATRGGARILLLAGIMIGLWLFNAIMLMVFRKARELHDFSFEIGYRHYVLGNVFIVFGVVFAITSLWFHEFRYGAAANAFADETVREANGRWILLNGAATEQILVRHPEAQTVEMRTDDEYRQALIERVRAKWPEEKALIMAAEISPIAFSDVAKKVRKEDFYFMNGLTTTPENWRRRWQALKAYREVRGDEFIPLMLRSFAYEACMIANRLQDEGKLDEAWEIYLKAFNEIEPKNFSVIVNMTEMLRQGYPGLKRDAIRVRKALDDFFKDPRRARHMREIVRDCGPFRRDPKILAAIREETIKRLDELKRNHTPLPVSPEIMTLNEWTKEMLVSMDKGDRYHAGRIARTILANPEWREFRPANAILGTVCGLEGDYEASAAFFEIALKGDNHPAVIVCNDYAETLRLLGRLEPAEKYARIAVNGSDEKMWLARMTLAEVLIDGGEKREEARNLIDLAAKHAPPNARRTLARLRNDTFKERK